MLINYWRTVDLNKNDNVLDDGLGGTEGYDRAVNVAEQVNKDLQEFGFIIAQEKCNWKPSLYVVWLGHWWDITSDKVSITEEHLVRLNKCISDVESELLEHYLFVKAMNLARLVDQIMSMHVDIKSIVRKAPFTHKEIVGRPLSDP